MRQAAKVAGIAQAVTVLGIVLLAGVAVVWGSTAARVEKAQASSTAAPPLGIMQMMATAKALPEQAFDAF